MKTLHIHIGTPKTGTTAIQEFCAENAEILEERGYCYPIFPFRYPHTSRLRAHFLTGKIRGQDRDCCIEQEKKNFREGMDRVRKLFHVYDDVILSDESIWRAMDSEKKDFWETMQKESREGHFKIHAIVYLRRQDEYITSLWNQYIKQKQFTETLEEFSRRTDTMRLDYDYKLGKIAAAIGKENITVRRYEKKCFEGGTIYSDFLSAVGLLLTDEYHIAQEVRNLGLYGNNLEIKRTLNDFSFMKDTEQQSFFVSILQECSELSKGKYSCHTNSREEILAFLEKYREGNSKVAKEYLNDSEGILFHGEVLDIPKWEKENAYMMDDLIRFTGFGLMMLHKENMEIKQELLSYKRIFYYLRHPFKALLRLADKIVK